MAISCNIINSMRQRQPVPPRIAGDSFLLRVVCFVACISPVGALLAKVYGLASMQLVTIVIVMPCCVGLIGVWVWSLRTKRDFLSTALTLGVLGGLFGSLCYDLARVPFQLLMGMRVFMPISAFGVWLAEAPISSRWSEVLGWAYHYSNGISFGIMYALFMRGRHWGWAIVWAFLLETIAVVSPFAEIFGLSGNYHALAVAYWGHVAFGLTFGWLIYRWDQTSDWLSSVPASTKWSGALLASTALLWPLLAPTNIQRDARARKGEFRVEGPRLNPDILRVQYGESIRIYNSGPTAVSVLIKDTGTRMRIGNGKSTTVSFSKVGIYQIFVETKRRTRSSFIMVEPVERLD
jgi:hypothetical protein